MRRLDKFWKFVDSDAFDKFWAAIFIVTVILIALTMLSHRVGDFGPRSDKYLEGNCP